MAKTGPKQLPRRERFYERVDKTGDCWLWTGATNHRRGGYGYFYDDDTRLRRAHRVAWELEYGTAPEVLMHSCDTPACVRLEHLVAGTQEANLADMRWKGRGAVPAPERGTERYNARLTNDIVRGLRERRAQGESIADLAAEIGVSNGCVAKAVRGETWAHVT